MKITNIMRAVLPLAAIVMTGSTQAQQVAAYSPGVAWDHLSWTRFTDAVKPIPIPGGPVTFETWATDEDTFSATPHWPGGALAAVNNEHRFQASALAKARLHAPAGLAAVSGLAAACSNPQLPPPGQQPPPPPPGYGNPGNFPAASQSDCIAEEVRRNRDSFNYIVQARMSGTTPFNLATQSGLGTAFSDPGLTIAFPKSSEEVKLDWAPVATVVTWLGRNGKTVTPKDVADNYYVITQGGTQYALLSMHISTKDRPDWLWATFEHQWNPGRCDTMGCYDQFGVTTNNSIPPNPTPNTQYPACAKSAILAAMFRKANVGSQWNNYCLKETQIDFLSAAPAPPGLPILDGDSVIERIKAYVPIGQSSCITCHAYATFSADGCVDFGTDPGIQSFPTPAPIGIATPQTKPAQKSYDFVWGLITISFAKACFSE